MTSVEDTAYPRLKHAVSSEELKRIYTPTDDEIFLAKKVSRSTSSISCFLILLKTFQRLGYFINLQRVPPVIVRHISKYVGEKPSKLDLADYQKSGTRTRHTAIVLQYWKVKPYSKEAEQVFRKAMTDAVIAKDDLVDIINIGIESLVKNTFELPGFNTLLEAAQGIRASWSEQFFIRIGSALSENQKKIIDQFFEVNSDVGFSLWRELKKDAENPTLTHLKELLSKLKNLSYFNEDFGLLSSVPNSKIERFAVEAKSFDIARMKRLQAHKRYTLAICLFRVRRAQVLDDLAEMIIKQMRNIHQSGEDELARYRKQHQEEVDHLIATLGNVVTVVREHGKPTVKLNKIELAVGPDSEKTLEKCEIHAGFAKNNYFSFLSKYFKSHRSTLLDILEQLEVVSTSQDQSIVDAVRFIQFHRSDKEEWIPIIYWKKDKANSLLNLDWIPEKWWQLVTGKPDNKQAPTQINRKQFEICVFSQVVREFKSGDLAIAGSNYFSDYRDQLIPWDLCKLNIKGYAEEVGLPVESPKQFVTELRDWLAKAAESMDQSFPYNQWVSIENGVPKIKTGPRKKDSKKLNALKKIIESRMKPTTILDILVDNENWHGWTNFLRSISGSKGKVRKRIERLIATTFCYGCNLGPSQTARSLRGANRKEISWMNHNHIYEKSLEKAINSIINRFNRFDLPKLWGSGKTVSVDGTKWDLRESNLLSEYHIRYQGYGGIGYYHVSDQYIALFSHFIPCGVWEAAFIFDGLINNPTDIKPDTIHGDTQAQNAPVFGLAHLLGIQLMPRIRNWKDIRLFKPSKGFKYKNIEPLFSDDPIDWKLIETHLPDMMQVVLSIKAGKITPSTILRKLGTSSRKNRLYFAFRELGRVARTIFLLKYINSRDLRIMIQAATNKSESYNEFAQWVLFGDNGIISENDREQQRKIIKYNHLVASLIIFHNVYSMTNILNDLAQEGFSVDRNLLSALSPYQRDHINRYGDYVLNVQKTAPPLNFKMEIGNVLQI